jgi:hypothetical protein
VISNKLRDLHPAIRVAGYVAREARIAELLAKRRLSTGRKLPMKEEREYLRLCEELNAYHEVMPEDERKSVHNVSVFLTLLGWGQVQSCEVAET